MPIGIMDEYQHYDYRVLHLSKDLLLLESNDALRLVRYMND